LEEQLNVLRERAGTETAGYGRNLEQLRVELQRMGQTVGRIEQERLSSYSGVTTNVDQLRQQVCDLRADVLRMQGTVDALLGQAGRSTVGSGGYTWGW